MPLIAHYKLDGNAEDALGRHHGVASGVTWADGKLGGAGDFVSGNIITDVTTESMSQCSLAFWIFNREGGGSDMIGPASAIVDRSLNVYRYPTRQDFHWSTGNGGGLDAGKLPYGEWTHVVLTSDGSKICRYYNGVLHSCSNGSVKRTAFPIRIGANMTDALLDDVRIYDHALSAREVRDLSQGLVLHYPCNQDVEATENLYQLPSTEGRYFDNAFDGTYGFGSSTNSQWSVDNSDQPFPGIPVQRVSRIESGVHQFLYLQWGSWFPGMSLQPGETITFSFWYYGTYGKSLLPYIGGGSGGLRFAATGWLQQVVQVPTNKWHRVVFSITNPTLEVQTCGYCWMRLHYDTDAVTLSNEEYWKFTAVQVEMKPHASDYTSDTRPASNLLTDASTQGNDVVLTLANSPAWRDEEYPGGRGYYWFSGDAAERIDRELIDCGQELTYACWAKQDSTDGHFYKFIVSSGRDSTAAGVNVLSHSGDIRVSYGGGPQGNGWLSSGVSVVGVWRHIVFTHDMVNGARLYVDGVLTATGPARTIDHSEANNRTVIGKMAFGYTGTAAYFPFSGPISDVRIYSTALTADQVKELYRRRGSIDDQGNFYAAMFNEMGLKPGIGQSGELSADSVSEVGITDGLIAYYPLTANADDYSGNGNHGVVSGAVPVAGGFDGKGAFGFDGVDDYIDLDVPQAAQVEITMSLWVAVGTASLNSGIFTQRRAGSNHYRGIITSGNVIGAFSRNSAGTWQAVIAATPFTSGKYHHVTLTQTGSVISLFVDGTLRQTLDMGNFSVGYGGFFRVGNYTDADMPYQGNISNIKIFNRALTPEEVAIEYQRTGPRKVSIAEGQTFIQGQFKEVTA